MHILLVLKAGANEKLMHLDSGKDRGIGCCTILQTILKNCLIGTLQSVT